MTLTETIKGLQEHVNTRWQKRCPGCGLTGQGWPTLSDDLDVLKNPPGTRSVLVALVGCGCGFGALLVVHEELFPQLLPWAHHHE